MVFLEDEVHILGEVQQQCLECCEPLLLKVWLAGGPNIVHSSILRSGVWHGVFYLGDVSY
jgi:hypothetical protein